MLMTYSSLMASDQPSLNQGRHSVTERQAPKGSWGNPLYPGILHLVVTPVKGIPLKNNYIFLVPSCLCGKTSVDWTYKIPFKAESRIDLKKRLC